MNATSNTPDLALLEPVCPPEPLSDLDARTSATVVEILADQGSAKRLADMGFVRGSHVEMLRPGRPCLVRIGNTYVGLGLGHQRRVLVRRACSN